MKKLLTSTFLLLWFALGNTELLAESIHNYRPVWTVGQSWDVEVLKYTEPKATFITNNAEFIPTQVSYIYRFLVEGTIKVKNQNSYKIMIKCISVDGVNVNNTEFSRIFIRMDDYTLQRAQKLSQDGRVYAQRDFMRGPVDADGWAGFLPMQFPDLKESAKSYKPKAVRQSADGSILVRASNIIEQDCIERENDQHAKHLKHLHVDMRNREGNDISILHTTQKWQRGNPWWDESICKKNGKKWCTAKLLRKGAKKGADNEFKKTSTIKKI